MKDWIFKRAKTTNLVSSGKTGDNICIGLLEANSINVLSTLLCLLALGCGVDLKEGVYACDRDGPRGCPPGWVCSLRPGDNQPRCYKVGTSTCGNGVKEMAEECDGDDFGQRTCETELGLAQGELQCTSDCTVDRSGCFQCGNGVLEGPEDCDGDNLGGEDCLSLSGKESGALSCTSDCGYDTSDCHTCGDTLVEGPEECDATNLMGAACEDFDFNGGSLICDEACMFDLSGCFECGDGICDRDKGENRQNCVTDCGWITVSAGEYHTCGLIGDGGIWCWGDNDSGQLGASEATGGATPVAVTNLPLPATSVSSGNEHSCALLADETVWCWGRNEAGQLGDGTTTQSATPVEVVGLSAVSRVETGENYSCALGYNGVVYCWGLNGLRQLGDGSTTDSTLPVEVLLDDAALVVALGRSHSCSITNNNRLWCWGDNAFGKLGTGDTTDATMPVEASALSYVVDPGDATPITDTAAGDSHSCALAQMGSVWCWGRNEDGQLGNGSQTTYDATPQLVDGLMSSAQHIATGVSFTCAVLSTGEISCWGSNTNGRLGNRDETVTHSTVPLRVEGMDDVAYISTGSRHACVMLGDQTLWCWGQNTRGQLGVSTTETQSATPLRVNEP